MGICIRADIYYGQCICIRADMGICIRADIYYGQCICIRADILWADILQVVIFLMLLRLAYHLLLDST